MNYVYPIVVELLSFRNFKKKSQEFKKSDFYLIVTKFSIQIGIAKPRNKTKYELVQMASISFHKTKITCYIVFLVPKGLNNYIADFQIIPLHFISIHQTFYITA